MSWFHNIRIGKKILFSYILVLLIALCVGVYVIISTRDIVIQYTKAIDFTSRRVSYIFKIKDQLTDARLVIAELFFHENTSDEIIKLYTDLDSDLNKLIKELHGLYDVAVPIVQEKIRYVLPMIEAYRSETKELLQLLLLTEEYESNTDEYRDVLYRAELKSYAVKNIYLKDMIAAADSISDLTVEALNIFAEEIGFRTNNVHFVTFALLAVSLLLFLVMALYMPGMFSRGLVQLTNFMTRASLKGDLFLTVEDKTVIAMYSAHKDEIGTCIKNTSAFIKRMIKIENIMTRIADGDLTDEIEILSDADSMGKSLQTMIGNLNEMQQKAVMKTEGPLLILAGAGSGKTTVL
ncbi:MAG: MCP four helix bundle domain-containing protein, partial [Defluviitaleaceae bacterium]|nr:MCP four helix bundle domain-containing protein [Defluviitaleaceae bacterium]